MTDFEQYLTDHKEQMNKLPVNPKIWAEIERKMEAKNYPKPKYFILKLAAAAAVLLLGILTFPWKNNQDLKIPDSLYESYGFESSNVQQVFNTKIARIEGTAFPASYKEDLQQLLDQVKYLDQVYDDEVTYLEEHIYEAEIAIQILDYYKVKDKLLNRIIYEIEKINANEKIYNQHTDKTHISL